MKTNITKNTYLYDLKVNDFGSPIGISVISPVFSWKMGSDKRGILQNSYKIEIMSDSKTVVDTGEIKSEVSVGVTPVKELSPCTEYKWRLTVLTNDGEELTANASFETGLPEKDPFGQAKFISCAETVTENKKLPVFRKKITVGEGLKKARLYSCGLGAYESYLNGERIGRKTTDGVVYDELKPGFTEGAKRKQYNTYDVTDMLTVGENAISAVVSHSWWSDGAARYGNDDAYLAKLVLTYENGGIEIIDTNEEWKASFACAILNADIFGGETYDARVTEEWKLPGFDDGEWENVKINNEFSGLITPWCGSFIRARGDLERSVKSVTVYNGTLGYDETKFGKINIAGEYGDEEFTLLPDEDAVIDLGQNFAGREIISVSGERGTKITITHGEMLNDCNGEKSRGNDGAEGSVYNANYRSAKATTTYIMNGEGVETYHPLFTFYGFRYLNIKADKPIKIHKIKGQVITSVEKETGYMETSDADINQLLSNIRWGQYSNYLSIPTDCPQRDERQGWTADTQVFTKAGCYLAFSKSFLTKFTRDMRDSQREDGAIPGTSPKGCYNGGDWGGTGWTDAIVIIPYQLYRFYGDVSIIKENWDAMQLYVDGFLGERGVIGPRNVWGDWLAYESNDGEIQNMLAVAFYAWDALMMTEMAEALALPDEAAKYRELYETEKKYFIEKYVGEDGKLVRKEQSVCLYALFLDLLPNDESFEKVKEQLTTNIVNNGNKLGTGFLGTAIILSTLTKIGRNDLAYSILLQHENPSWLYSVDQGATTIWERWNSYTKKDGFGDVGMNSFNHYAYGAVLGWMFETMAGIAPEKEGFKRVLIAPVPDERLSSKASYNSAYGEITAESVINGGEWTYNFKIPANTTATVVIPAKPENYTVSGEGIKLISDADGVLVFDAVSGEYEFVVRL